MAHGGANGHRGVEDERPHGTQGGNRRGRHRRAPVPRHRRGPGVCGAPPGRGHLPHHPQGGHHPDPGALRPRLGGRLRPGLKGRGPAEPGPHPAGGAGGRARGPGPAESPQPPPGPGYGGPCRRTRGRGGLALGDSPGAARTECHSRGHQPLSVPAGRQNLRVLSRLRRFFPAGALRSGPATPSGRSFSSPPRPGPPRPSRS